MSRLTRYGFRAAVVGPKGNGKTTFLLELQGQLTQRGYPAEYLRIAQDGQPLAAEWQRVKTIASKNILLLDGTEQLSTLRWQMLKLYTRAAKGLVISRHTPAELPTLLHTRTSVQLVEKLLEELREEWPVAQSAEELYRKFDGNVREIFRYCYDVQGR